LADALVDVVDAIELRHLRSNLLVLQESGKKEGVKKERCTTLGLRSHFTCSIHQEKREILSLWSRGESTDTPKAT
jgi:hypothetical protein